MWEIGGPMNASGIVRAKFQNKYRDIVTALDLSCWTVIDDGSIVQQWHARVYVPGIALSAG